MADPVVYILQNSTITIPEMCSVLLDPQCMQHLGLSVTPAVNWVLPLPKPKPFKPRPDSGKQMKMLHMTDIHLDLYYTPGSNALCDEPMCCRSTSHGHNNSAGYWSEMSGVCDTPLSFTEEAVKHIGNNHKDLDFVIWTGDSVPHDEWNCSETGNLLHINTTTNLVKKYLKGKSVFPIIGNHEPCPFNMYVPNEVSIKSKGQMSLSWLYNTLADDYWAQWINTASAKKAFKRGGFYSIQLNDRLKIVVLNNNICGGRNYWVAYNPVDPDGQLKWFIDELDSAETQGIHVLILTHQPMSACYESWGNNYMRIVERYANVIVSTYYGHTHYDEIQVLYTKNLITNETYPISHGYVGSSLTTFSRLNPGYKIFTLDSNGKALDYDLYYTNMTADNIAGKNVIPKWSSEKALKKVYGLDSLTTDSWHQFLTKAQTEDKLLLNKLRSNIDHGNHTKQACNDCVSALTTAKLVLKTPDVLKSAAKTICKTPGVVEPNRVCVGTLNIMSDPVVYILQNSTITIPEMCGVLLDPQCMQHLGLNVTQAVNWVLPLPKPKPFNPSPDSGKQMKMLHMTDIHLDLYYTPGSNALCDEPMCCRSTSHGHNYSAGYWSETASVCDTPLSFTEEAVKHIGNNHKDLDFVIWTGDSVPHDGWNCSVEENLDHIYATTNLVKKYLNGKSVFPIIGNHEPYPFNMYVPNEVSIKSKGQMSLSWLYDTLADKYWSQWINTVSAKTAFKTGGYYSTQLNDRLKIVVLNNN
ncbi:unnamed protein product, partial [Medioppia subpectinata]